MSRSSTGAARIGAIFAALLTMAPVGPVAAAPAAPTGQDDPQEVARLYEEWRYEEADRSVQALLRAHPSDPVTQFLDANMRFLDGDYGGAAARAHRAIAAIEKAGGSGGNESALDEWRGFAQLVDDTAEATRGFVEARSPEGHFIIRHAAGRDEVLLPYAFEALEAARRIIGTQDFRAGALLAEPVRVEIYPEVADLAKVSTLTLKEIETSGTIAICKFNRLMIVSPRALVHGYPWLDTLAHEFTHFIVSRVSHNTVPIWFQEGLAKFEERRWRMAAVKNAPAIVTAPAASAGTDEGDPGLTPTMEHLLATALVKGRRLITFDEMYPSMAKLPSQEDTALAFAEVFSVVEYLHLKKGWEGVRAVVERMRDGKGDARAVADVLGQSFDEFQRGWKAWLRSRKLHTRPGLVPSSLHFARGKHKNSDDGHDEDDAQDVAEERARKFVRLGGMLRTRGRLSAAAAEYERAQALVGPGHFVIASKLARTLLALGDAGRAIAVAAPAFELYPDSFTPAAILGEAWWKKRDGAHAAPYLEEAIRINPFDPSPHCALAEIYAARADKAVEAPRAEREQKACRSLKD